MNKITAYARNDSLRTPGVNLPPISIGAKCDTDIDESMITALRKVEKEETEGLTEINLADIEAGVGSIQSMWSLFAALQELWEYGGVNLINSKSRNNISEIRENDVVSGRLVTFEGEITSASSTDKVDALIHFQCQDCWTESQVVQDILGDEVSEPHECRGCEAPTDHSITFREPQYASQSLIVEELPGESDGNSPADIEVVLHDELVGVVEAGERVEITGIVYDDHERTRYGNESIRSTAKVVALGFDKAGDVDLNLREEEEAEIRNTVSEPDFFDRLQDSFAPNLVDLEREKRGLIAAMMTGGDINVRDDTIRGDSNVLLIGNPQTGKSALIKWLNEITPRGDITSGDNSSGVGLTATAVEDSRLPQQWTLKAGHLVRCNGGVACIDELDKSGDLDALHTPLESGEVWRDVAGQSRKMQSKCRVFAAANPEDNEFDTYKPIADQFQFPPSLLSRFDLIYAVESKSMDNIGEEMADSLFDGISEAQAATDGSGVETGVDDDKFGRVWLTKYVHLAWSIDPMYTSAAMGALKDGWMTAINGDGDAAARELESLARLAKGLARMRLSETVDVLDAERAVGIWQESLDTYAAGGDGYDLSIKDDGLSSTDKSIRQSIKSTIEERETADGGVHTQDIHDALSGEYEEARIAYNLKTLRESGDIYRLEDDDHYRSSGDSR